MPDTNQPPFMPPSFIQQTPANLGGGGATPYSGPTEDGPGNFTNPANSTTMVRYTGQSQTAFLNVARPWYTLPWEDGPGFADPGNSNIAIQGPQNPNYSQTPTLGVGVKTAVPTAGSPAQVRMFLQGGSLYIVDNSGTAYVVNATGTAPAPPVYSPTK